MQHLAGFLWSGPLLALVLIVGAYSTFRFGALQFRCFFPAWRAALRRPVRAGEGDISSLRALTTALGGIVGNGNIAGVATAITAGGPGALFWMWVSGWLGMATMFAESTFGLRYRVRGADGMWIGGPMYYLRDGLGWRRAAWLFAAIMSIKTLVATTSVQSNSMASVFRAEWGVAPLVTCLFAALATAAAVVGGVRSIGRVSALLTPLMGALYLTAAGATLAVFAAEIGPALELIVRSAWSPAAPVGAFAGAGVKQAVRFGLARGVYSNEAGTGSVPIAHASASAESPETQGKIAMLGVFLDTQVVATATGLVLLATGGWSSSLDSSALTAAAMAKGIGASAGPVILLSSVFFGLSTLITWEFYGEQCTSFLLGTWSRRPYRFLYCFAILGGAVESARVTWALADFLNALVIIPNALGVALLVHRQRRRRCR